MENDNTQPPRFSMGNRWPELITAALLLAMGAVVLGESHRIGNGWADDGPESGYFIYYIGVLLMAASGFVILQTLWRWRVDQGEFATSGQLASVMAILIPMAVYVGGIMVLGIYYASAVLIFYFMRRHGKYKLLPTLLVALGVPTTIYFIFERWFLVLLPKGSLQQWIWF